MRKHAREVDDLANKLRSVASRLKARTAQPEQAAVELFRIADDLEHIARKIRLDPSY